VGTAAGEIKLNYINVSDNGQGARIRYSPEVVGDLVLVPQGPRDCPWCVVGFADPNSAVKLLSECITFDPTPGAPVTRNNIYVGPHTQVFFKDQTQKEVTAIIVGAWSGTPVTEPTIFYKGDGGSKRSFQGASNWYQLSN